LVQEEVRSKTDEILEKLEEKHEFVQDLKDLEIGSDHETVNENLNFHALEDVAEIVEGNIKQFLKKYKTILKKI
jgi:hypothetical protein